MGVITITTVVGNVTVLSALRRMRRAPAHYPLASLAIADLLVGVFVLPLAAARELFSFHINWPICAFWSTLDVLCCTASILSLCALGWVRWCGITAPLACARRARLAKIFAALVWPISTVVALPTAFIPSPRNYLPDEIPKACSVNINLGYVFFSISCSFYLPAIVMVVLYARICLALSSPPPIRAHRGRSPCVEVGQPNSPNKTKSITAVKGKSKLQELAICLSPKGCHLNMPGTSNTGVRLSSLIKSKGADSPGVMTRQRRATRTIVMLMSLFLICWTPFFVMLPVESVCECVRDAAWEWCTWLGYANSALNPLVYAAASPGVRRALHASFTTSTGRTDLQMSPAVRRY